jgi:hypothetical protein
VERAAKDRDAQQEEQNMSAVTRKYHFRSFFGVQSVWIAATIAGFHVYLIAALPHRQ